jgi:uncharacterized protein (DUF1810 family)
VTFDLNRFVLAQERDFDRAVQELRDGQKRGHWIWYIFPQLAGLGSSLISEMYGLHGGVNIRPVLRTSWDRASTR